MKENTEPITNIEENTEEAAKPSEETEGSIYSQFDAAPSKPKKKRKKLLITLGVILALLLAIILTVGILFTGLMKHLGELGKKSIETQSTQSVTVSELPSETQTAETNPGGETESTSADSETTEAQEEPATAGEDNTTAGEAENTTSASGTTAPSAQEEKTTKQPEKTTAAREEKTTKQPEKPTSAGEEKTTKQPERTTAAREEKTTSGKTEPTTRQNTPISGGTTGGKSSEPSTSAPVSAKNEYDIYRGGCFYALGTITDSTGEVSPMELAITEKSVYMVSEFEGSNIGLLYSDDTAYMINRDRKTYMTLNSVLLGILGGDAEELFDTSNFGFEDMQPLEKALRSEKVSVNGVSCIKYVFAPINDGTVYHIFLNGTKLVRVESHDTSGNLESTINFQSITDNVPKDKTEPSSFKKQGMIEFFKDLGEM